MQKQLFLYKHDDGTAICDRERGPTVVGRVREIVRNILAPLTHQQNILQSGLLEGARDAGWKSSISLMKLDS